MKAEEKKEKVVNQETAIFRTEDGWCFIILLLILLGIGYLIAFNIGTDDPQLALIGYIVYGSTILSLFIFLVLMESQDYCTNCEKRIFPIFRDHICYGFKNKTDTEKTNIDTYIEKQKIWIKENINLLRKNSIIRSKKEEEILRSNFLSLKKFEYLKDYKYVMVAYGSIIEFLLKRYFEIKNIKPNGKSFVDFIQTAINKNIFRERKRWEFVQSHLRDFRNYVHIDKEIREEKIDYNWYMTMRPVFEKLLEDFKRK